MFKTKDYKELTGQYVLIDVRSPGEYKEATIPGAINLPIFNDEERKEIGTVYVQENVEKAKKIGVEAAAKKLPQLYNKILELEKIYGQVVFFCARGGMRSGILYSMMTALGVNCARLRGGYKGYRAHVNEELPKINKEVTYIVLRGNTGVGKTEILKELEKIGLDTVDLEGAANHRGSILGSVGLGGSFSQKQFEGLLYEKLRNRKSNFIFLEGESKRIGNIIIPQYIHEKMQNEKNILVEANLDFRVELILKEYTKNENYQEQIIEALGRLKKYISEEKIERYTSLVEKGECKEVVEELMVKYYDPMYGNKQDHFHYDFQIQVCDFEKSCKEIEEWYKNNIE